MILGIGVDIVHVNRMAHWLERPELMHRFFHPSEIEDALRRGKSSALSLAARFAAKEAFGKALGTGLHGLILKEIRVKNNRYGKPDIELLGRAKKTLEEMGGKTIHLTMTHERDNAVAMVVLEGEGQ
ncbi:4'-phosphopantetheinyl transferase [Marispirochaeta aestuarii]|uniref:Holo-[acyl-carrier-protein] synthase n=1 Tax=Marispirochaeta aestuarii TaxID=1963862 RepID=A0A1Y1RV85_9SPIO|nr:holo-ACP synthase [Marispirochaeta aestuarii]ORC33887.1 4'-phosphopantetheinyl transferase [Marispirochaeta aestuarii]